MTINLAELKLPKLRLKTVAKRTVIASVLLVVPLGQFFSFFLALPLIVFASITSLPLMSGKYWLAAFIWMYPSSPIPVIVFFVYFFILFYVIELFASKLGLSGPERERKRRKKLGYDE